MSKERPILFSTPMVRALRCGTKTQTRRIIRPQPEAWIETYGPNPIPAVISTDGNATFKAINCPYGVPGERLWVRETWLHLDQAPRDTAYLEDIESNPDPESRADLLETFKGRWKPSIHMHRYRCRITLDIAEVRVQRLQDISEEDAMAEGVDWKNHAGLASKTAKNLFRELWESINGPGSWDANPWVWVVTFTGKEAT